MVRTAAMTTFLWCCAASEALATRGGHGPGWGGGNGAHGAPEIDGPAGIAAIAVLVSAGLIAYNRYRKK